jgi:hypothetical protein
MVNLMLVCLFHFIQITTFGFKFKEKVLKAETKRDVIILINKWNEFIRNREDEDYCMHSSSKYYMMYRELF